MSTTKTVEKKEVKGNKSASAVIIPEKKFQEEVGVDTTNIINSVKDILTLPMESIGVNWEANPRGLILDDSKEYLALRESMRLIGQVQPIGVKFTDSGRYKVAYGYMRFKAAKELGWKSIQAVVRDASLDYGDTEIVAAAENEVRSRMNPVKVAEVYARAVEKYGGQVKHVARMIGVSENKISEALCLASAPQILKDQILHRGWTVSMIIPCIYAPTHAKGGEWMDSVILESVVNKVTKENISRQKDVARVVNSVLAEIANAGKPLADKGKKGIKETIKEITEEKKSLSGKDIAQGVDVIPPTEEEKQLSEKHDKSHDIPPVASDVMGTVFGVLKMASLDINRGIELNLNEQSRPAWLHGIATGLLMSQGKIPNPVDTAVNEMNVIVAKLIDGYLLQEVVSTYVDDLSSTQLKDMEKKIDQLSIVTRISVSDKVRLIQTELKKAGVKLLPSAIEATEELQQVVASSVTETSTEEKKVKRVRKPKS